jgi:[protein-PII] uridylyltransferase
MPPVYLEKVLRHAERELVHQSHLRPTDLLDIYRRFLKLEEHRLKLEHIHGEGGRDLCKKRADVISVMLRHLWNGAWETHLRSHMDKPPRIALLAVGGFGRGELNPYSDIDILFLYPDHSGSKITAQVNDIVQHVLYMLWDIGFQVGHATRTMQDLVTQANSDLRTKTSLLEARFLCGDEPLFAEFEKTFERKCLHGHEKEYLAWRVADQSDRHDKAGHTPFLQEPNVKSGCGGLRDYQNLMWVGKVKRGLANTQAFVDAQLLTPTERKQLDRAYDFLLRIRTELHYLQKRSGDVLTLRLQGQIADSFGYQHRTILRRMEAFMRDYYERTSLLFNLGNTLCNRLCGSGKVQTKWAFLPFHATHREEIDGFVLENGELELPTATHFSDEPLRLVRVFLLAQQHNAELGPELKLRLRRRLYMIDRRFIYQTAVRETLLAILSRKGQVGRALRTMHELGFLGRFFPEFRPLTCLVQHEFFHRYTADEHTLVCIEMLDKIIDATEPPFSKYRPLLQQTARPHILYLAMLLHDTGKSENDSRHAEASAVNAVRVARRMRLKGAELSILVFLVDHHLTMSEIARRKNLDNEDTIIEFARIVQTQERLDLLMLLTFADTLGTGSGRGYSDWKDLLLWQLYHRTSSALSGVKEFRAMAEQARLEIQQRLLKNLDRQFDPAEVVAHFENLPPSYFETMSEELIREHIAIVHGFLKYQLTHDDASLRPVIHWRNFPEQGHSEVTVVTWDRNHLFARVTGSFTACALTILKADIFTRTDDIAINTFYVATERLEAVTDTRDRAAFEKILGQAMGMEQFDFAQAFAKRVVKPRFPVYDPSEMPTKVSVDLRASRTHALLDVQTADYPGLLYRIACAIADANLNLSSARITTEKGAALDTFYLTDRNGKKIESEEVLAALIEEVRKRIAT